ncbi:YCF48-related protein [Flavobacterium chuncheonense]|uniref:YCF48-related protein n=1 Tax=Flavobacterium chuncheonense TaxID=2026653 RepID=A0ABW5YLJ7_9FLAO
MKANYSKKLLAVFFLFSVTLFSQTFSIKPSGTNFILYDLSIPPGQNTIAYAAGSQYTVNSSGIILKSTDGGETWQNNYTYAQGFKKIAFVSTTRGFALGYNNTLLKTIDGGSTWVNITVQNDIYYYSQIEFLDANKGFLSGITNGGQFIAYKTLDAGETWTVVTSTTNLLDMSVSYVTDNVLYSVGANQKVSKSVDGGNSWTTIKSGMIGMYYFATSFKDVNNGVVSGEDGEVLLTTDGGTTWTTVWNTGYENFYGLKFIGNKVITAGTDHNIYYSQDSGATWIALNTASTATGTLYAIEAFDNGDLLLCGSQGSILKSDNFLFASNFEAKAPQLTRSYNEETNILNIESLSNINMNSVEFVSLEGKQIFKRELKSSAITLDLNFIQSSVYIVRIEMENGSLQLFKFIKR